MSIFVQIWNHVLLGELGPARAAADRLWKVGETIGDRRLQSYAKYQAGSIALLRDDVAEAVRLGEEAITLAPDPLALAVVLQFAGEALGATGDLGEARARLERSLEMLREVHMPQLDCWALARLAEVEVADGRTSRARELADRARDLGATFRYGAGLAERALGRVALADRDLPGASSHLEAAAGIFRGLEASYEVARTLLDLGALARVTGDEQAAARNFSKARDAFAALGVPAWADRAARLAGDPGPAPP
jgi:ATP/maltotriose-dependent transcriptional regulator MalT